MEELAKTGILYSIANSVNWYLNYTKHFVHKHIDKADT